MKKLSVFLVANLMLINFVFSQGAAINTTGNPADNSAILDVSATGRGLLIPRMTTANRPANPAESLIIYNTTTLCFEAYNATTSLWVNIACIGNSTCGGTITDSRDNKTYNTVLIGTQCWLKENLNANKYLNGEAIPNVTDSIQWSNLTTGAYCNYNNDAGNDISYGRLYNWYTVNDSRKLCPTGWHVPSHDEWTTLEKAICISSSCNTDFPYDTISTGSFGTYEGGKLKEAGTAHWFSPNTGATNSSGFTALPGSYRDSGSGVFDVIGSYGYWWSTTQGIGDGGWARGLSFMDSLVARGSYGKTYGFSVRCIKD